MNLQDQYDGSNDPFEGDRTLLWRRLPSNAQILKAIATVIPVDQSAGASPYEEDILFDGSGPDWGATKVSIDVNPGITAIPASIEVDFHKRRTLASVMGTNTAGTGLTGANLQVELGGLYVEINQTGAIFSQPPDLKFPLPPDGSLPGLTVSKFKLTQVVPSTSAQKFHMDVTKVTVRSAPSNVSLRLRKSATFWVHLGDFTAAEESSDFAAVLQTFLAKATVDAGYYLVPMVLHSDTMARLIVKLEIEYLSQVNALPTTVSEAVLPFDFSTIAKVETNLLAVDLPRNARAVPGYTTMRLKGAFQETRIAVGSVGAVTPVATADVSPAISQAQFFSPSIAVSQSAEVLTQAPVVVSAVDLLLAAQTPQASLRLDIRADADGKPDVVSLLQRTVDFRMNSNAQKQAEWVSVTLPSPVRFDSKSANDSTEGKYWLTLQSLDGEALWQAEEAIPGAIPLQQTRDGALSWRDTSAVKPAGPLAGIFRLRTQPDRFKIPIQLQVGTNGQVPPLKLDDFEPLGRVDFTVNTPSIAQTINDYVAASQAQGGCEELEYLANGNFERWMVDSRPPDDPIFVEQLSLNVGALTVEPNGAVAYAAISPVVDAQAARSQSSQLETVDTFCNRVLRTESTGPSEPTPNTLAISPDGRRIYLALGTSADGFLDLHSFDALTLRDLGHVTGQGGAKARPLAISANGRWLYWAAQEKNEIGVFDLATLDAAIVGQHVLPPADKLLTVPGGGVPMAIDVAPDGSRIYVAIEKVGATGPQIITIDLATGQAVLPTILLPATPTGMAITSDGAKLWIVLPENGGVASVVLSSGRVEVVNFGEESHAKPFSPWDVAVTPEGTKLFLIGRSGLMVIQLGSVPAEWSRTLGYVTPICSPGPKNGQHQAVALLGMIPSLQISNPLATGLSQVAPVSGGCPVEFSFFGVSSEQGALAEVFWLQADGTLLRADQLQIVAVSDPKGFRDAISTGKVSLQLHRERLLAPTAASQAEVRFTVPAEVLAAVSTVSLAATTEFLVNDDFAIVEKEGPANWTLSPPVAPGVVLSQSGDALEFANAGSEIAELYQTVGIQSGHAYVFEFEGRVVPPISGKTNPRIEVDWQKADGSSSGSPGILEILPTNFSTQSAIWNASNDAAQARIRLIVPPTTALEVRRVSLQASKLTTVPLNFLSHAPGELRVSETKITFDVMPAQALAVPAGGLAKPTPPDQKPGDPSCDCCCTSCGLKSKTKNLKPVVTPSGRAATTGTCASCGQVRLQFGGPVISGSQLLTSFSIGTEPPDAFRGMLPTARDSAVGSIPLLSSVQGIDQIRVWQLRRAGIVSLEELAKATPKEVARALRGVSVKTASDYVERARSLLAATP